MQVKETPQEVCQDKEVVMQEKVCEQVQKKVDKVKCETTMKEIELKEICVDIDIQLPREECNKKAKEECKYEPEEVILNRCEPTVKEVCETTMKKVCDNKCKDSDFSNFLIYINTQVWRSVRRRRRGSA